MINYGGDRASPTACLTSWLAGKGGSPEVNGVTLLYKRTSISSTCCAGRHDFCFVELRLSTIASERLLTGISQPTTTRSARARGPYSSSSETINLVRPFRGPPPLLLLVELMVAWRPKSPLWPSEGGTGVVAPLGD